MTVVDDIKSRLDIVDLVSAYVTLKKSGRYFKAPCPFHTEKTPSFVVNQERQSWYCFGACATGGDAFSFIMAVNGIDFGDALRLLADKSGVKLGEHRENQNNETLFRINQVAARFYRDVLESSQGIGSKYLVDRGVDHKTASTFGLGLSPPGWDELKSFLIGQGFTEDQAVEAGLLSRTEDGRTRDFFRDRLMFCIHNKRGAVTGFGARTLDGSMPKYINTPSTPIFDKRSTLYGLHLASESIRNEGTGVVVEGYMDAIACHQFGYTNVVASMGTAVTQQQVSQLKSIANNFVLALDPDEAGQEATIRSLESSWQVIGRQRTSVQYSSVGILQHREPVILKVAALPNGRDPDGLIRDDHEEWRRLIKEAVPLMDFLIPAVAARIDTDTGFGKQKVVEILFPIIASTENNFDQDRYFSKLANAIDVTEASLRASIGSLSKSRSSSNRRNPRPTSDPRITISPLTVNPSDLLEQFVLELLLNTPHLKTKVSKDAAQYFRNSEYREIFTQWLLCNTIDDLKLALDELLHEGLIRLLEKPSVTTDRKETGLALSESLSRLEIRHLRELQREMLITEDVATPPGKELEEAVSELNAAIKESFSQRTR